MIDARFSNYFLSANHVSVNFYPDSFPVRRNFEIDRWNSELAYRSFSRDVITVQNLKLKIHQMFYPHQA